MQNVHLIAGLAVAAGFSGAARWGWRALQLARARARLRALSALPAAGRRHLQLVIPGAPLPAAPPPRPRLRVRPTYHAAAAGLIAALTTTGLITVLQLGRPADPTMPAAPSVAPEVSAPISSLTAARKSDERSSRAAKSGAPERSTAAADLAVAPQSSASQTSPRSTRPRQPSSATGGPTPSQTSRSSAAPSSSLLPGPAGPSAPIDDEPADRGDGAGAGEDSAPEVKGGGMVAVAGVLEVDFDAA